MSRVRVNIQVNKYGESEVFINGVSYYILDNVEGITISEVENILETLHRMGAINYNDMGNNQRRYTFVQNDNGDWSGMYVDGTLEIQNHSLDLFEVLDFIGVEYERRNDEFDISETGRFPNSLDDLLASQRRKIIILKPDEKLSWQDIAYADEIFDEDHAVLKHMSHPVAPDAEERLNRRRK